MTGITMFCHLYMSPCILYTRGGPKVLSPLHIKYVEVTILLYTRGGPKVLLPLHIK